MFKFGSTSKKNLSKVHPNLVKVMNEAIRITTIDFRIHEGARSLNRQRQLVRDGYSTTLRSRHLVTTGGWCHAVDCVPIYNGKLQFSDWKYYHMLAPFIKQAAKNVGVTVEWGGDWKTFKDGPHWQLPWRLYP